MISVAMILYPGLCLMKVIPGFCLMKSSHKTLIRVAMLRYPGFTFGLAPPGHGESGGVKYDWKDKHVGNGKSERED